MTRLSRPCYDKAHRCPGWAGGGMKSAKVTRCKGGYVRTKVPDLPIDEEWVAQHGFQGKHPGVAVWHPGYCTKCAVVTIPWALTRLDPTRFPHWARWQWWRLVRRFRR